MAGDQVKTIVNGLDPKSMNELFDALPLQPDAALTSITPISPNKFRFLFVWPASNPIMTYERVGRSFVERFAGFAEHLKPMATGFCLNSRSMIFGSAAYGEEEVNVAYRDIEVHYRFGSPRPCAGRYLKVSDLDEFSAHSRLIGGGEYGAALPNSAPIPPRVPADSLTPFLKTPEPALPPQ